MKLNEKSSENCSNDSSDNNSLPHMIPSFPSEYMSGVFDTPGFHHSSQDFKHSFSLSQIALPPKIRNSTVYTVLSPDTSKENGKSRKYKQKKVAITEKSGLSSSISLAQNKEYCYACEDLRSTALRLQCKDGGFWRSVIGFIKTIKCCGDPGAFINNQEIISYCLKCGTDLNAVPVKANN